MSRVTETRTPRRLSGDRAEVLAAAFVERLGWLVVARNVFVGRDEIDLVAVDPGPPQAIVFAEIRSNASGRFGAPEESLPGAKLQRTYRAAFSLMRTRVLPDGKRLPRCRWRVDVIAVEHQPSLAEGFGGPVLRHLRAVAPE